MNINPQRILDMINRISRMSPFVLSNGELKKLCDEFKTKNNVELKSFVLKQNLCSFNMRNKRIPDLDELSKETYDYLKRAEFFQMSYLLNTFDESFLLSAIKHLIQIGEIHNISDVTQVSYFHRLAKRFPSKEEFLEYIENYYNINANPDNYCINNDKKIPTKNLNKLKSQKSKKDVLCTLCQNDIKIGDDVFVVPKCQHHFHFNKKECLDGFNIHDWLAKNSKCPVCQQKVKIV